MKHIIQKALIAGVVLTTWGCSGDSPTDPGEQQVDTVAEYMTDLPQILLPLPASHRYRNELGGRRRYRGDDQPVELVPYWDLPVSSPTQIQGPYRCI